MTHSGSFRTIHAKRLTCALIHNLFELAPESRIRFQSWNLESEKNLLAWRNWLVLVQWAMTFQVWVNYDCLQNPLWDHLLVITNNNNFRSTSKTSQTKNLFSEILNRRLTCLHEAFNKPSAVLPHHKNLQSLLLLSNPKRHDLWTTQRVQFTFFRLNFRNDCVGRRFS